MDVGLSVYFQSPAYLDESHDAAENADLQIYQEERELAEMAEPLGFDSVWSVEHHFTGYTMTPDVLQFLAYMAGRTSRVQLGSMVVVLPWHNPARVADSVAMLDNLCDGRLILGLGRGLGRVEFEGLGVPMDESRGRFVEGAELVLRGLEAGVIEYDGQYFQQPRRVIRPAPTRSFRGRTYAAAVSPESLEIMARLGVGILVVPQKPWDKTIAELDQYRELYRSINESEPPSPIVACQIYCDEDGARAEDLGVKYMANYYASVLKHYELAGDHFGNTAGYEYYSNVARSIQEHGADEAQRFYASLHVYGTPDQCVDRVAELREKVGCDHFIGIFRYGGIDFDDAKRNLQLFADKVHPRIKAM
jgi:alkanesulfonate monooxygenase SsuD/methylene tetrahydromethanopterin reductase-like flavin-dependent oxidoreductase (luciferase family)